MERQRLRHEQLNGLLDGDPIGGGVQVVQVEESSVITPPKDFQDHHLLDSCKITSSSNSSNSSFSSSSTSSVLMGRENVSSVVVSGGAVMETILEPPAMFRPAPNLLATSSRLTRPRTELFWSTEHSTWNQPPASNESASQVFSQELERLKSHSLFLRFPLDGAARVHYRSSRSVVVQSASLNQYR